MALSGMLLVLYLSPFGLLVKQVGFSHSEQFAEDACENPHYSSANPSNFGNSWAQRGAVQRA
jgi:hypothetical protein